MFRFIAILVAIHAAGTACLKQTNRSVSLTSLLEDRRHLLQARQPHEEAEAVDQAPEAAESDGTEAPVQKEDKNLRQRTRRERVGDAAGKIRSKGHEVKEKLKAKAKHAGGGLGNPVPPILNDSELKGDKALKSVHGIATHIVVPVTFVFILCIMLGNWLSLQKYTRMIPDSAATVFVSVLLGCMVKQFIEHKLIDMEQIEVFNAAVLNLVLLPIIIFASGWNLNRLNFLSQLEYVLVFAVFGTIISTCLIAWSSWAVANYLGWHEMITPRENLVFAALISAVDPVATLSTYDSLNIATKNPLLHTLVFGESVINDAVAIVFFNVVNHFPVVEFDATQATVQILWLLLGSTIFGVLLASILILFMRIARLPGHTHTEIIFIILSAYFIFAFSEASHLSGIISNLCAGICFRRYGSMFLAPEGEESTSLYLDISAHAADNTVFLLCGASTALMTSNRGFTFGVIAFFLCAVARAAGTGICCQIANALKRKEGETNIITPAHAFMMWHGGLRGGIALVLAMEIDATWCEHKGLIIDATFFVICAMLLVFGSTTEVCLTYLGLADKQSALSGSKSGEELATDSMNHRWASRTAFACDRLLMSVLVGESVRPGEVKV